MQLRFTMSCISRLLYGLLSMPNRFKTINLSTRLLKLIKFFTLSAAAGNVTALIEPANSTAVWMGETLNLQFQCNVSSSEIPSILWTFTNMTSKRTFQLTSAAGTLDSRYLVTFPTQRISILTITDVRLPNHGLYTCLATTGQLSSQASSTLSIQSKIPVSIL